MQELSNNTMYSLHSKCIECHSELVKTKVYIYSGALNDNSLECKHNNIIKDTCLCPGNKDTSIIRTLLSGPKRVHIEGFHCTCNQLLAYVHAETFIQKP